MQCLFQKAGLLPRATSSTQPVLVMEVACGSLQSFQYRQIGTVDSLKNLALTAFLGEAICTFCYIFFFKLNQLP